MKHCRGQKFNVDVIKTTDRKTLFSQDLKISRIFDLENVIRNFTKNLVNVAIRMEDTFIRHA